MRASDRDGLITSAPPVPVADADDLDGMLLRTAGVGLAAIEWPGGRILRPNPQMRSWFGIEDGTALAALFPYLDPVWLEKRVAEGREPRFDAETTAGRRKVVVSVRIRPAGDGALLILECQDASKEREQEYMLQSYSAMVERQNLELAGSKDRVERLLLNIMPKTVHDEWKRFGVTSARLHEEATTLMLDFVGFTDMAALATRPS